MNATEWLAVCKMVEARWGPSRKWDRAGDLALEKKVVGLDRRYAELAIDDFDTDHAPAPVKILWAAYGLQETQQRLERGLGSCRHRNWAFLEMDTNKDGRRRGTCVACGAERWFDEGKLLTATEAGHESGQFADLVPPESA